MKTIKTNLSKNGPRLKSDNVRRVCRLQDRGAVQGRSESQQHVDAHRCGGREAWLARGVILFQKEIKKGSKGRKEGVENNEKKRGKRKRKGDIRIKGKRGWSSLGG